MAMRLTEITAGQALLNGEDVTGLSPVAMRPHRRAMQTIFQDSYSALDLMMTLADIIAEPLRIHRIGTRSTQREETLSWFECVGLTRDYANRDPHELSGDQRQRVAVARALILKPKVLVADEPTSAFEVSLKAQIVNLLQDLQAEMGRSIVFISHDLSVVRGRTDWIIMNVIELFSVVPPLLAALLLGTITRGGFTTIVFIAALLGWVQVCLLVRTQVKALREKEFVTAAHALGASSWYILWRHLIPNAISSVIVGFVLAILLAMMLEASLSFLGIGIPPPVPSWGQMINVGMDFMFFYWFMAAFPTATLALAILATTLFGDGLRDALDPTLKGR
ncbi:ABC transporter permease subunit [Martelella alba]|uniref:ABC transporter permease subunit n=1 Tax=Martelella alba TaxID=2590451 RepID=A0A506U5S2_9HYPH|nr:ABC transporter permease subunit [Martelella alba]TPW29200.1 ABC transporter permease subunit [Martelella alba]